MVNNVLMYTTVYMLHPQSIFSRDMYNSHIWHTVTLALTVGFLDNKCVGETGVQWNTGYSGIIRLAMRVTKIIYLFLTLTTHTGCC